jgi:hypothetical protein
MERIANLIFRFMAGERIPLPPAGKSKLQRVLAENDSVRRLPADWVLRNGDSDGEGGFSLLNPIVFSAKRIHLITFV